jgi:geranylgeranyl diphosphate synthase type I
MRMKEYFADKKTKISAFLKTYLDSYREPFSEINVLGDDAVTRLYDFAVQGKMIRGGLVSLGHDLFAGGRERELTALGGALELLQSALLIHDDIMDRDFSRRGHPSLFYQYAGLAEEWKLSEPYHTGESLGICAGDIAFFLAFDIIGTADLEPDKRAEIFALTAKELSYVGVAQMVDVVYGVGGQIPTPEDVMRLYRYKTGRYTFSLPLLIGGIAAGRDGKIIETLESLGMALGTIFQIKDDELGLFGEEEKLGKPIGSDIREGKKTLHYLSLLEKLTEEELKLVQNIVGNREANTEDITRVRELMYKYDIPEEIRRIVDGIVKTAETYIEELTDTQSEVQEVLVQLLEHSVQRTR